MLVGLVGSSILHFALIAVLPISCSGCISKPAFGYSRLDARLSTAGARSATAKGETAADATLPATPVDNGSPPADGLSIGRLPNSPSIEPPPLGNVDENPPLVEGMPVSDQAEYFPTKDLQIRPHPIRPIEPTMPDNADSQEARVVLHLWISPEGRVDRVVTVSGPADDRFSRSAATAFAMSRFSPGVKNGVPVGVEMFVEVIFDREMSGDSKGSARP